MYTQTSPEFWSFKTRKYLEVLLFGIWSRLPDFPSVILHCALYSVQPPMLWSTRRVPVAPLVWGEGRERCSLAPARKKGLRGLLFLLSDSIYMGTSGPGVYYATQAGCEELWRGWRCKWSMLHHHGDSVTTVSVNLPPGSVRNHTLGWPCGSRMDSQLLISFASSQAFSWPDVIFIMWPTIGWFEVFSQPGSMVQAWCILIILVIMFLFT